MWGHDTSAPITLHFPSCLSERQAFPRAGNIHVENSMTWMKQIFCGTCQGRNMGTAVADLLLKVQSPMVSS